MSRPPKVVMFSDTDVRGGDYIKTPDEGWRRVALPLGELAKGSVVPLERCNPPGPDVDGGEPT